MNAATSLSMFIFIHKNTHTSSHISNAAISIMYFVTRKIHLALRTNSFSSNHGACLPQCPHSMSASVSAEHVCLSVHTTCLPQCPHSMSASVFTQHVCLSVRTACLPQCPHNMSQNQFTLVSRSQQTVPLHTTSALSLLSSFKSL